MSLDSLLQSFTAQFYWKGQPAEDGCFGVKAVDRKAAVQTVFFMIESHDDRILSIGQCDSWDIVE